MKLKLANERKDIPTNKLFPLALIMPLNTYDPCAIPNVFLFRVMSRSLILYSTFTTYVGSQTAKKM